MALEAIFFDRDGVINIDHGYVASKDRLEFIDAFFRFARSFPNSVLKFIVTNQSGIARGYYTKEQFIDFMFEYCSILNAHSIKIDGFAYCPHHPDFNGACECRKPAPKMIKSIARYHNLNLRDCVMIGDNLTDALAGEAAGVGLNFILGQSKPAKSSSSIFFVKDFDEIQEILRSYYEFEKKFNMII